jgi:hypothetical protein
MRNRLLTCAVLAIVCQFITNRANTADTFVISYQAELLAASIVFGALIGRTCRNSFATDAKITTQLYCAFFSVVKSSASKRLDVHQG